MIQVRLSTEAKVSHGHELVLGSTHFQDIHVWPSKFRKLHAEEAHQDELAVEMCAMSIISGGHVYIFSLLKSALMALIWNTKH